MPRFLRQIRRMRREPVCFSNRRPKSLSAKGTYQTALVRQHNANASPSSLQMPSAWPSAVPYEGRDSFAGCAECVVSQYVSRTGAQSPFRQKGPARRRPATKTSSRDREGAVFLRSGPSFRKCDPQLPFTGASQWVQPRPPHLTLSNRRTSRLPAHTAPLRSRLWFQMPE